jgi:hypothetical protein
VVIEDGQIAEIDGCMHANLAARFEGSAVRSRR